MDALVSLSFEALLAITLIVFLGGLIKGFLGFGMPLFATPLMRFPLFGTGRVKKARRA